MTFVATLFTSAPVQGYAWPHRLTFTTTKENQPITGVKLAVAINRKTFAIGASALVSAAQHTFRGLPQIGTNADEGWLVVVLDNAVYGEPNDGTYNAGASDMRLPSLGD